MAMHEGLNVVYVERGAPEGLRMVCGCGTTVLYRGVTTARAARRYHVAERFDREHVTREGCSPYAVIGHYELDHAKATARDGHNYGAAHDARVEEATARVRGEVDAGEVARRRAALERARARTREAGTAGDSGAVDVTAMIRQAREELAAAMDK